MRLFRLRRKEQPWEVVENRCIDPVPIYYEDGGKFNRPSACKHSLTSRNVDLDLISMGHEIMRGTYTFDLKPPQTGKHFRSAVVFARQRLLQAGEERGFNNLLMER